MTDQPDHPSRILTNPLECFDDRFEGLGVERAEAFVEEEEVEGGAAALEGLRKRKGERKGDEECLAAGERGGRTLVRPVGMVDDREAGAG